MTRNSIRLIVLLGVLAMVGIIPIQAYWVKRTFDLKERQFNQNVHVALKKVAEQIREYNKTTAPLLNPVSQYSSNYFVVNVQDVIDVTVLEHYLKTEFEKTNLVNDYEYGIYDCVSNRMVYGNFVSTGFNQEAPLKLNSLPVLQDEAYYFGIYFPSKTAEVFSQMPIWIFSSAVFLLVVIFFAYTLWVVLKQRRLTEVQRDFINNMTHEFKTPLATISVSSEVLRNPEIVKNPERLSNYANIIYEEAHRLKNQVERVLQIAVSEREVAKIKQEPIDIHELINRTLQNIEPNLKEKDASIDLKLDAINALIKGDHLHLSNILYNMLDNALKYNEGTPQIVIYTRNSEKDLIISIADNGIGIAPNLQKKIFEKFYRVPTGNIHNVKGFGLGLNYVRAMVKAHQGKISLNSQLGQGSIFHITLPNL